MAKTLRMFVLEKSKQVQGRRNVQAYRNKHPAVLLVAGKPRPFIEACVRDKEGTLKKNTRSITHLTSSDARQKAHSSQDVQRLLLPCYHRGDNLENSTSAPEHGSDDRVSSDRSAAAEIQRDLAPNHALKRCLLSRAKFARDISELQYRIPYVGIELLRPTIR
jgi:hypothetical protein